MWLPVLVFGRCSASLIHLTAKLMSRFPNRSVSGPCCSPSVHPRFPQQLTRVFHFGQSSTTQPSGSTQKLRLFVDRLLDIRYSYSYKKQVRISSNRSPNRRSWSVLYGGLAAGTDLLFATCCLHTFNKDRDELIAFLNYWIEKSLWLYQTCLRDDN